MKQISWLGERTLLLLSKNIWKKEEFYDRVESPLYLLHAEQINEQYVRNICPQGQFFPLLIRIVRGVYERAKDTGTANPGVSSRGSCLFRDSRDDFDFASVCHINSASLLQPK